MLGAADQKTDFCCEVCDRTAIFRARSQLRNCREIKQNFFFRVCCEFRTQTMIFDQKRFDGVMRQIFGENGSFLARFVLEPDRLRRKRKKNNWQNNSTQ